MKNFRYSCNYLYRGCNLSKYKNTNFINKYNIKTIIDLRSDEEILNNENPIIPGVDYYKIPIINYNEINLPKNKEELIALKNFSTKQAYKNLSKSKYTQSQIIKVIDLIDSRIKYGNVYVHCVTGKDRTGIICALYQLKLGYSRKYIYKDFLKSNRSYRFMAIIAYIYILFKTKSLQTAKSAYNFYHLIKREVEYFIEKDII